MKTIVAMTSWKKRISYVGQAIFMMLQQTKVPDEIVLTLSSDEFENKEKDLPKDLCLILQEYPFIRIKWQKENTRAFKKVIPLLKDLRGENCWIITIDDDWKYNENYIETMIKLAQTNPQRYLTPGTWGPQPHGYAMIYNPKWFTDDLLWSLSFDEMEKIVSSDEWMQAVLLHLNILPKVEKSIENLIKDLNRDDKLSKLYANKISIENRRKLIKEKVNSYDRV